MIISRIKEQLFAISKLESYVRIFLISKNPNIKINSKLNYSASRNRMIKQYMFLHAIIFVFWSVIWAFIFNTLMMLKYIISKSIGEWQNDLVHCQSSISVDKLHCTLSISIQNLSITKDFMFYYGPIYFSAS